MSIYSTHKTPLIHRWLPPYTKDQLRAYLEHGRERCRATIRTLTAEKARQLCSFAWGEVTFLVYFLVLLLCNMRHIQEHAAQLSLFLGQKGLSIRDYVTQANSGISDEWSRLTNKD
jgi:DinB superfamily